MHRASASENPAAPLAHHLQDSTHISFGVRTSGFTYRWFKLEGSLFNGREPDEKRYNFEAHPWNSRSARLSFAPNSNWSLQLSHGFLRNPEALEPGDTRRTTASISYNKQVSHGNVATSLIWGRNHERHKHEVFNLNGYTAEATVNFVDKNYLYTRLELVDKNQLLRAADLARLKFTTAHPAFRIGAFTFGGARDLWTSEKLTLAMGGDLTFYEKPAVLNSIYGNNPFRIACLCGCVRRKWRCPRPSARREILLAESLPFGPSGCATRHNFMTCATTKADDTVITLHG